MKKHVILYVFVALLLVGTSLAESDYVFRKEKDIEFQYPCFTTDYDYCPSTTGCGFSLNYPNGTNIYKNATMSYNDAYFNITIHSEHVKETGDYKGVVFCTDGSDNGFDPIVIEINDIGKKLGESSQLAVIVGISVVIFFLLYLAFKLERDHFLLKLLIIFFVLGLVMLIPATLITSNYASLDTFSKLVFGFFMVFIIYFSVYIFWHYVKQSEQIVGVFRRR